MLLLQLAVHFYRVDFTEGQAKSQIKDMVSDLAEFTLAEVEKAITAYRQMTFPVGKFKPFPDSGALRGLIFVDRKHRADLEKIGPAIGMKESRPHLWWMQPKCLWRSGWLESDVPAGEFIKDVTGGPLRQPDRMAS